MPATNPDTTSENPGFYALALQDPQRLAFIGPQGEETTFGELGAQVNRISHGLRALGVGKEDMVAILVHNGREYIELALATIQLGAYIVPINTHLAPPEVAYIVKDSTAKVLVAHSDLAGHLRSEVGGLPAHRYAIGGEVEGWQPYPELWSGRPEEQPGDRVMGAIMNYTSGTTGRPKGVRRPLSGLSPEQEAPLASKHFYTLGFRKQGVHLACSPLYHAAPGAFAINALHLGHTVVCHLKFNAEAVLRAIERYKVTTSHMVPTHFHRMLRLPEEVRLRYDVSSLDSLIHAAAPCPVEVKKQMMEWVGPKLYEYLAATEGGMSQVTPEEWLAKPGTVGRPQPGTTLRIVGENGEEVPDGEPGTIYFSNAGQAFEYYNDPGKTAAARLDGMSTVGDFGYLDEDGYLFLLDRRTDLIISGGVNIYPAEIEQFLITHPSVQDIAVIGVPDPDWGQSVLAIVQPSPGVEAGEALAEKLRAYCAEGLASYKRPRRFEFREDFPRTEAGKLQRRKLRDEYVDNS
ncbi:AMP-binding protein [Nonomuraea harbinensis]|uniref:AMP-binding protein n=1 Tax=Nonomuraea harbinensis TaxID=1286938 RepID=A0ABW1C7D6_9ACTN|nr:AMP-binding protein [Nonomuraea harbinensis]